ncbi:MAG: hypothetical protein Q8S08_05990 [Halomonas sp.]|nr:hypothetical protein [Halomonas sp.]MDP3534921.1 hypothetical protein [Halomonas sp.]
MEDELLRNVSLRLTKSQLTSAAIMLALYGLAFYSSAAADTAPNADTQPLPMPQPFEAQYQLEIRGWPSASITHTLNNEGFHWLSDMRFSVTVARGQERSRFTLNDNETHSLLYNSSYSLFGIGDSYQLDESDISSLDRQAALFDLSRRAGHENCTANAPCDIEFVDHRGRDEHFQYYVTEPGTVSVPAGEFEARRVTLFDVEKPDRHLQINFHPEWPGLILSARYEKEGRRQTQLTMTQFNPAEVDTP